MSRHRLDEAPTVDVLRPMRVGMVVPYDLSESGGVKHHAMELARTLRRRGDDVTILGPAKSPLSEPGVVGFRGVANIVSNGSNNALGVFVSPWGVWNLFRRRRFDIVHIHEPLLPSLNYWSVLATPRTPHVATFHALGESHSWRLRTAAVAVSALQFPFIHRGIAVSPAAAAYAASTWNRPLEVIPNGVRTDVFRPRVSPAGAALKLLFVGRISDERKGLRYLLDAYRQLRAAGRNVELSVVGDNTSGPDLPSLPGMTYHGSLPLPELVEQYQRCDVFVAPSTGQESFGIVLLEAMACGKAIICSDIMGYRWSAASEGTLLVPPRGVTELVSAIERLIQDRQRAQRMGERNRVYALRYDWERIACDVREQYLQTIEAVRPTVLPLLAAPDDTRNSVRP